MQHASAAFCTFSRNSHARSAMATIDHAVASHSHGVLRIGIETELTESLAYCRRVQAPLSFLREEILFYNTNAHHLHPPSTSPPTTTTLDGGASATTRGGLLIRPPPRARTPSNRHPQPSHPPRPIHWRPALVDNSRDSRVLREIRHGQQDRD